MLKNFMGLVSVFCLFVWIGYWHFFSIGLSTSRVKLVNTNRVNFFWVYLWFFFCDSNMTSTYAQLFMVWLDHDSWLSVSANCSWSFVSICIVGSFNLVEYPGIIVPWCQFIVKSRISAPYIFSFCLHFGYYLVRVKDCYNHKLILHSVLTFMFIIH